MHPDEDKRMGGGCALAVAVIAVFFAIACWSWMAAFGFVAVLFFSLGIFIFWKDITSLWKS